MSEITTSSHADDVHNAGPRPRPRLIPNAIGVVLIAAGIALVGSAFRSAFRIDNVNPVAAPSVKNQALERSNVSVVDAMSHITAVSRNFEALQRGLVSLMTDVDGRAITELGRR